LTHLGKEEGTKVRVSEEVVFLQQEKEDILQRWRHNTQQNVNTEFFTSGNYFTPELLERIYYEILDAVSRNHYRDLNQTFDAIVRAGFDHALTLKDAKGFLFNFSQAALDVLDTKYREAPNYDTLRGRLRKMAFSIKTVYSERVARGVLNVLEEYRGPLTRQWKSELPTTIISDHFSVIDEEDLDRLVQDTFDMYLTLLRGAEEEVIPDPAEEGIRKPRLEVYLRSVIDFYEPKGFLISDLQRALLHLTHLAEPLLYRHFAPEVAEYRMAKLSLDDAGRTLNLAFSEAYNDRQMRNYYEEVSIMLHRIKNKLTAVPTTMQTIMMYGGEEEGWEIIGDPMLMTPEESRLWAEFMAVQEEFCQTCVAVVEELSKYLEETDPLELNLKHFIRELQRVQEPLAKYQAFLQEHSEDLERIKFDLDPANVEVVDELLRMVYEGGILTQQLTMELQIRQNELYQREPPKREELDIYELVKTAYEECLVEAQSKNLTIEFHGVDEGVKIFGVRNEIKRPFIQVIENAIKYTPEGGRVDVKLEYTENEVVFSVKDTGIGIPPGEEDLVFGLCQRCTNAQEFNKTGTGTGLYNDRKIVLHHNGRMWVESPGINRGSTFYIALPIYRRERVEAKAT